MLKKTLLVISTLLLTNLYADFTQVLLPGDPEIGVNHAPLVNYDITFVGVPAPISNATLTFDTSGDINNGVSETIALFQDGVFIDTLYNFTSGQTNIIDSTTISLATFASFIDNGEVVFTLRGADDTGFHTLNSVTLTFETAPAVPEPTTLLTLAFGLIAFAFTRKKSL